MGTEDGNRIRAREVCALIRGRVPSRKFISFVAEGAIIMVGRIGCGEKLNLVFRHVRAGTLL